MWTNFKIQFFIYETNSSVLFVVVTLESCMGVFFCAMEFTLKLVDQLSYSKTGI